VVLDDREAYANNERHPRAIETRTGNYESLSQGPFVDAGSFVVVTHQHAGDEKALRGVLRHAASAKYIGVIGSALKVRDMYRRMLADGFEREELEQVYAPIGIDHGGQSAEEIALAICAELVAARYGKQLADSMRTRSTLLEQLSPQD
jgi:xanthine dehydrogenase accessory factor